MLNVIRWQFFTALLAACIGAFLAGAEGAVSATLAALAIIVPSCCFALWLTMAARQGEIPPVAFLVGEFAKVTATIALLALIVVCWTGVNWPALLIGVIMVLQANFLALWKKA
ncbi:MAG: ATP synthase subunit I [Betaproteobacteria bacterium]|nr:ATP synthase subunit I [Betaproteobacteria bacterium]